jgi:serine/threonine protein kinase
MTDTASCASWVMKPGRPFGSRKKQSKFPSPSPSTAFSMQETPSSFPRRRRGRYVALKVFVAANGREGGWEEISFLNHLCWEEPDLPHHKGMPHVQKRVSQCLHMGPNGNHHIIVIEPMGRTLEQQLAFHQMAPKNVSRNEFVREASKQLVLGLDYIHSKEIAHRGVFPISFPKHTIKLGSTHHIGL